MLPIFRILNDFYNSSALKGQHLKLFYTFRIHVNLKYNHGLMYAWNVQEIVSAIMVVDISLNVDKFILKIWPNIEMQTAW